MNIKHAKTIHSVAFFIITQETCFAMERPIDQHSIRRASGTAETQIITPIPAAVEIIQTEEHLPAIEQINKQLRHNYGRINPGIKLDLDSHAEISRLSAKYESFPIDISYNHEKNQATLTWKTGAWGWIKAKTKEETFSLATRSTARSNHLPTPSNTMSSSRNITTQETIRAPSVEPTRMSITEQTRAAIMQPSMMPSNISSADSVQSMICLSGTEGFYPSLSVPLKTYVFRREISNPRTIHDGKAAFFMIYHGFPDIYKNFTLGTGGLSRVAQDFVDYGCPVWMNVALHDNGIHMLIFEWDNAKRFHYKLMWK